MANLDNDFVEKVKRGEDLRWVGSRCPLTSALTDSISVFHLLVESTKHLMLFSQTRTYLCAVGLSYRLP